MRAVDIIMPRSRIPQPKTLNDLKGDSHKRRRHDVEPEPPKSCPEPPDYLDEIARTEWDYITGQPDLMGLLSSADRACIKLYVGAYSRYRRAEAMVAKFGEVLISKKTGTPYLSPYSTVIISALDTCRRMLTEMGLTPASRARCRMSSEKESGFGAFEQFILRTA